MSSLLRPGKRRSLLPTLLLIGGLAGLSGACAGDGDEEDVTPADLVDFQSSVKVSKEWSASLGADGDGLLLGLAPVSNGARLFAASDTGKVIAFDAVTGKQQWSVTTELPLSAGPGLGVDAIAVASSAGDVVLLAASDGATLWQVNVQSEILSAPAVGGDSVVIHTVDGRLLALSERDGSQLWSLQHPVQGLTLRGSGAPVISGEAVVSGFDDGRVVAVKLADGEQLWEARLSEQRGRTPLDRLADIDGSVAVVGEDVFVAGYQGSTALLSLRTGQPVWRQEMSSHSDLALDWNRLYVTAADDAIIALSRSSGAITWRQADLSNRQVSGPAIAGNHVAVGDFEGYVHWIDAESGKFVARSRAGNGAVVAAPLVVGSLVVVQTSKGELTAFRAGES